jgi:hypothetical protein
MATVTVRSNKVLHIVLVTQDIKQVEMENIVQVVIWVIQVIQTVLEIGQLKSI